MNPARLVFSLLLMSGTLAAQSIAAPTLSIEPVGPALQFTVSGPQTPFFGGVLLSLSPTLSHYFQGLPPLLSDFVVLGVGFAEKDYSVKVLEHLLPPGIMLYAQGVVADEVSIQSTAVVEFVLDASFPERR